MSQINELTQEHRDAIPGWVAKWIAEGLRTDEADWEKAEEGIKRCYQHAKLAWPGKIIRVQSPLVGALSAPIAANIIFAHLQRSKVRSDVYSAVGSAVRSDVYSAVGSDVRSDVYSAVGSDVRSAVYSAVGSAVRSDVGFAVDSAVDSAVYSAVGSAVRSDVYSAVRSDVRSAVGSDVRSAVYSAVDSAVYSAVESAVYSAVRSDVRSAVDSAVGSDVRSAVYSAVDSAVYSAVGFAVYSAVGSDVRSAVDSVKLFWHYWLGGQFWVSWQAYEKFFREILKVKFSENILDRAESYELIQTSANYWWPNKNFVMVCNRPSKIALNEKGQLHCNNGMAIEYRDGWGLWMLNGVRVPKEIVLTPAHDLDPNLVLTEKNAEVRREIVRKIGIERVIQKLHGKVIDKWGGYELITLKVPTMTIVPKYLKMRNPSIGTWHVEGVPPNINTCREALSWRCGGIEWNPGQLT